MDLAEPRRGRRGPRAVRRVERGRTAPLLDLTVLPQVARGLITVAGVMGSYRRAAARSRSICRTTSATRRWRPAWLRAVRGRFRDPQPDLAAIAGTRPGRTAGARAGALLIAALGWSPLSELVLFVAGAGHARGVQPDRRRDGRQEGARRARAGGERAADHGRAAGPGGGDRDARLGFTSRGG